MKAPANDTLPFFAYGLFRGGQLGFLSLAAHLQWRLPGAKVAGRLLLRDGLPVLNVEDAQCAVEGDVLAFRTDAGPAAYEAISLLEPDQQYVWGEVSCTTGELVNVLLGKDVLRGAHEPDVPWNGRDDPLFKEALEVVEEALVPGVFTDVAFDPKPLFRYEAAYLLLWTAIERYAALRYSLGTNVMKKVLAIATEPAFQHALMHAFAEKKVPRMIYTAKPTASRLEKITLNPNNPKKALEYYYGVRSNMVHRGKAAFRDLEHVQDSLRELLPIFRATLYAAFEQSAELAERTPIRRN
jgi:hypothetical protein